MYCNVYFILNYSLIQQGPDSAIFRKEDAFHFILFSLLRIIKGEDCNKIYNKNVK